MYKPNGVDPFGHVAASRSTSHETGKPVYGSLDYLIDPIMSEVADSLLIPCLTSLGCSSSDGFAVFIDLSTLPRYAALTYTTNCLLWEQSTFSAMVPILCRLYSTPLCPMQQWGCKYLQTETLYTVFLSTTCRAFPKAYLAFPMSRTYCLGCQSIANQ